MFKNKILNVFLKSRIRYSVVFLLALIATSTQVVVADNSDLAGNYYERAVLQFRKGEVKSAILELKNAIQQNPDYLAAQILLAKAYLRDKNLTATEVALSRADKLNADPALLVKTRAQMYLFQLKYGLLLRDIAIKDFDKTLQPDLHLYRGQAYLQLNQLEEALTEYKMAEQKAPDRVESVIGRADVLRRMGKIQKARDTAEKAAKMQPDSAGSWYIKGAINHSLGDLQQAIFEYGKALKFDPKHYDARLAHAGVLMDLNRDDEAEKDLVYLRDIFPFDANVAYLHSVILARNNKHEQALEALTAASVLLDGVDQEYLAKHAQSLMLNALVNYSLKRFDIAMHALNIYIQNYPRQPGPYKMLASILLDRGEHSRVVKLLQPVLVYAPNDYRLLFLLGSAYMKNGQHDQANALLEKASVLQQQGVDISTELGLNRLAMGQEELAINELERAVKANPGNTKAGIPLVLLYMNQRQPAKANQVAVEMSKVAPDNLTLLNLLGTTQVGLGEKVKARKSFTQAITNDPGFITAHLNLSKLDIIEKNPDAAKQRINKLLEHYPQNIALLMELARIYEVEKNYAEALIRLQKARNINSKSISVTLALIELGIKAERFPEALSLALEAQKQDGENLLVLDALARCFMINGQQSKAAGVLRGMSRKAGFNAKQLYKIARQQFAMDDIPAAIKSLKNAVSGNKNFIPARIALAEAELQLGNEIFTLNHAKFLIEYFPDRAHGYRLLGDIAYHQDNKVAAIQHYQTAFEKGRNTLLLMKFYAALKQNDQDSKAFQLVKKWVDKNQDDAVAVQTLAEEYLNKGRFKAAQKFYEQLERRFKNRPDLLNNLAYIYFNLGDNRALHYAQQAQRLAPDQPSANDTLGWILVNQGEPERGLHYLRNAHARSSKDPEIRYHVAVALNKLQRFEEAKAELKQALLSNRSFNGIEKAKLLLEKLKG